MSSWLALGLCIGPILFAFIGWKTGLIGSATVASKPANENVPRATPAQPKEDIWAVIDNALNRPRIAA
jgi:hypothetical protein